MDKISEIRNELQDAIKAVLNRHNLEMHGEIAGLLQEKDRPETATGWRFPIGNGIPQGWKNDAR